MPFTIRPRCRLPLIYFLRFMAFIAFLILSSGPVYADWVAIISSESSGGYTVYVDPDNIRHEEDGVEMWELYDHETRGTQDGYTFSSFKKRNEYGCAEKRLRTLATTYYSGRMGNGRLVSSTPDQGKWKRVPPGSVGEALWKVACNKK